MDLNHGPIGLQPIALPLSYVSFYANDDDMIQIDQLGHSDDTMYSFVRCCNGRAHHPICLTRESNPGLLLGRQICYHYNSKALCYPRLRIWANAQ